MDGSCEVANDVVSLRLQDASKFESKLLLDVDGPDGAGGCQTSSRDTTCARVLGQNNSLLGGNHVSTVTCNAALT